MRFDNLRVKFTPKPEESSGPGHLVQWETLDRGAASYIFSRLWCAVERIRFTFLLGPPARSSRVITDSMQLSDARGIVPLTA